MKSSSALPLCDGRLLGTVRPALHSHLLRAKLKVQQVAPPHCSTLSALRSSLSKQPARGEGMDQAKPRASSLFHKLRAGGCGARCAALLRLRCEAVTAAKVSASFPRAGGSRSSAVAPLPAAGSSSPVCWTWAHAGGGAGPAARSRLCCRRWLACSGRAQGGWGSVFQSSTAAWRRGRCRSAWSGLGRVCKASPF